MKKNKMMRIASVLLVAVILTTCAISGTFAKYVTSQTGSDTARVAKFGVAITANGSTFAKDYGTDDTGVVGTITKSVVSTTDKVVAPGTRGDMSKMELTGTPEVAVHVSYEGSFDISDNWTVEGGAFYCPLKIKFGDNVIDGATFDNAADFENAVNAKINAYSKDYPAGTNLNDFTADSLAVSWEWPFHKSDENDSKDTWLGNQAAAGNAATVTLTIKTTVTQID